MMMKRDDSHWKLDRRIPFAVILTMMIQAAAVLIWATQLDARVSGMEQQSVNAGNLNEKFARLDERLDGMKQNLDSVRRQLDHLTDRLLGE